MKARILLTAAAAGLLALPTVPTLAADSGAQATGGYSGAPGDSTGVMTADGAWLEKQLRTTDGYVRHTRPTQRPQLTERSGQTEAGHDWVIRQMGISDGNN
ncbi:MAG TPA: hypothetical protein PLZ79_08660 [Burkholderiales bacterium]|nr:hypothetical protein [Betaproteobacteria bacterium]HQR53329.1 hypothetical protein [Burkholderiales bacterium]